MTPCEGGEVELIDISMTIREGMVMWPGDFPVSIEKNSGNRGGRPL